MMQAAYRDKTYPNLFAELGIDEAAIDRKVRETFDAMFFDPAERIYLEVGDDMACMVDTGNNDARTEGMSYGMMMAVQMDRKDIFDRLWKFSKTFMYQPAGKYQGYFAWSVALDGRHNAEGPAPDGEEYFAMALFFAGARWGEGTAPFDYAAQARDILHHCVHQHELGVGGDPMWDPDNKLIKFIPESPFSDPSYHLPHYYELFAELANEADRPFWREAAKASRQYIVKASHPETGMTSELAEFDGSPRRSYHDGQFYSDAYRVAMNVGLDAAWFGNGERQEELAAAIDRLQAWFSTHTQLLAYHNYMLDGTALDQPALHPWAIVATNAAGSLAATGPHRMQWVRDFWELPLRTGDRRYYDNCLYFFCLLMLAGRYRIYL